ncbi:glycosyl hydrolase [Apodospora peruviana]|uniref:Glycosyl hydrolase n=1 Tax=Apodospora peruviana TaxID=516989 RepID=A0AAE0IGZ0_9PEZI|nr:glycosyl hydrolase [Apodospora peruviana]
MVIMDSWLKFLSLSLTLMGFAGAQSANSTYLNPVLPGWHSDPSCTQVNGTFFCATSTFIAFPGIPIYASKDLVNWKLASHAWNRESQLPGLSWKTVGQQEGMFAPTLRYHDGQFYVICEYLGMAEGIIGVVFKSSDPFSDKAWSDPVIFHPTKIDPDIFWDDDGKVYVATQGIILQELNLTTGKLSQPPISLWNGTGGVWPEGPHIYKKDGWYYLMIAEGGTATDHSITIARSRRIDGPYEPHAKNPILTNRGTNEYFQTVGHGDLFQDTKGNWWGMCLATRSGPEYNIYPMGREAALFPVTWKEGEWPVLQPVQGRMSGWSLPPPSREGIPGDGPFISDPDVYDFEKGTAIPRNLMYWRVPRNGTFSVTAKGLQVVPSRNNLTGTPQSTSSIDLSGQRGLAFIGRRQTDTLFTFSVVLSFSPQATGQEAGVTVFLTQVNHIDLGVVRLSSGLALRLRAEGTGAAPTSKSVPVPSSWDKIRLQIQASNSTHYDLSAMPARNPNASIPLGTISAGLVSGGNGSFVGSLLGVYATCNGAGTGVDCPTGGNACFTRWRYYGKAQYISANLATFDDACNIGFCSINGATIGGWGANYTNVSTVEEFTAVASASGTGVIIVNGAIAGNAQIPIASSKTIVGTPGSSLAGISLNLIGIGNVIIRNLRISNASAAAGDAITIQRSRSIWIDHCEFSSGSRISVVKGSDYVTVTNNLFHDHADSSPAINVGASDEDVGDDTGKLHLTFARNYFKNVKSAVSFRFGTGHLFNSYYENVEEGINTRMGADVLVEASIFSSALGSELKAVFSAGSSRTGSATLEQVVLGNSSSTAPAGSMRADSVPYPYDWYIWETERVKPAVTRFAGQSQGPTNGRHVNF